MFGLAMLIFSFFVLRMLEKIYTKVKPIAEESITGPFFVACIIGILSEIGLRMVVK